MRFEVFNRRIPQGKQLRPTIEPRGNASTNGAAHEHPRVTIQKRGNMSINGAAHEAMGRPDAVVLLYDVTAGVVAMRQVDPADENAYPLRSGHSGPPYEVAGGAFANHYGIDTGTARRYDAKVVGQYLCIDLTAEGTVVTSGSRGRARPPTGVPVSPNGSKT